MTGVPPSGSGSRASHRAAKAARPKASIPNAAARRRTFKPFAQAPRDGTPFNVPYIFRYNPFAKTFEALMRDQMNGELEWVTWPRLWQATYFCDILPLKAELPTSFAMTFVAEVAPQPRKSWRERLFERVFGWLQIPDTTSMLRYCWSASAMSAFGQDPKGLEAKPASAVPNGETPNA